MAVFTAIAILRGPAKPDAAPAAYAASPNVGDSQSGGQGQDVDGVKCEGAEQFAYHVHAHLAILLDGQPKRVSKSIGIVGGLLPKCIYWLHTHDESGIIHIESPNQRVYTLGEFFDIWGQPLSRTGVGSLDVPGGDLGVFVDGQVFDGDPRDIELKSHTQVVIEIGKPGPPPVFTFPSAL